MDVLSFMALCLVCFILLVHLAYCVVDGIVLNINGTDIEFNNLTYKDLEQFDLQPNSIFIVIDGDEQVDITTSTCNDSDTIKSITAVVAKTNSVCDFSVFNIHVGDTGDAVLRNMPRESTHMSSNDTNIRISRYVDKDNNVLIIGTDIELDVVSYITIRVGQ